MAMGIPNIWSFLTCCLQVTWPGACAVIILAFKNTSTGCGKKWTPKVFRCFLSNRLKFWFDILYCYWMNLLHITAK